MGEKVVVLEDDEAILELMETLLSEDGYDVLPINHYEASDFLADLGPQIILIDIRLSNGYGHNLCKELKANPLMAWIPVILVSGADNLEKIARECNANGYISKPFDSDELLNMVKKLLYNTDN